MQTPKNEQRSQRVERGSGASVVHLPLICFGMYLAGTILHIENANPAVGSLSTDARSVLLVGFSFGIAIAAIVAIVATRTKQDRAHLARSLNRGWIVCSFTLSIGCFWEAAAPALAPAAFCAVLSGICLSLSFLVWARLFASLPLRSIILNSALAFVVFASTLEVCIATSDRVSLILNGLYALIGLVAYLVLARLPGQPLAESQPSTVSSESLFHITVRLISSVPVAGVAISVYTTGTVFLAETADTISPFPLRILIGGAIAVLACTLLASKKERALSYTLFNVALPAIATFSLIIKIIPIDEIETILFKDYMFTYFQLALLSFWVYTVSLLRTSQQPAAYACGIPLIFTACMLVLGFGAGFLDEVTKQGVLGLATAAFLILSAVSLGRGIVLINAKPSPERPDETQFLDTETACKSVSDLGKLSPRETEVLIELAYGHTSSYIAKALFISDNTVRSHMKNIYKKLDINSREELLELVRKKQKTS